MSVEKENLRKRALALRSQMSGATRALQQKELDKLLSSEVRNHPDSMLFSYMGFRGEYDPGSVLKDNPNRIWCFPRMQNSGNDFRMDFYRVDDLSTMIKNKVGILEPNPSVHSLVEPDGNTMIILPCVAATRTGDRLGYGNGFYDRYLERFSGKIIKTIAPVFSCQIFNSAFAEAHDRRIDLVLVP